MKQKKFKKVVEWVGDGMSSEDALVAISFLIFFTYLSFINFYLALGKRIDLLKDILTSDGVLFGVVVLFLIFYLIAEDKKKRKVYYVEVKE